MFLENKDIDLVQISQWVCRFQLPLWDLRTSQRFFLQTKLSKPTAVRLRMQRKSARQMCFTNGVDKSAIWHPDNWGRKELCEWLREQDILWHHEQHAGSTPSSQLSPVLHMLMSLTANPPVCPPTSSPWPQLVQARVLGFCSPGSGARPVMHGRRRVNTAPGITEMCFTLAPSSPQWDHTPIAQEGNLLSSASSNGFLVFLSMIPFPFSGASWIPLQISPCVQTLVWGQLLEGPI